MSMIAKNPTTQAESGAGQAWTNPSNITGAPNGVNAQVDLASQSSKVITLGGLGFSLPPGAKIQGFIVRVRGSVFLQS
jgi:hypothetical protein